MGIAYNYRIGNTPLYATVYHTYKGHSRKEAADTELFFIRVKNYA